MISPSGSLLIAHPNLQDPNFRRSVLFIAHHDADGSFGVILNRSAGRTVSDLLPDRSDLGPLANLPVFLGGPVGSDQLIFASFQWDTPSRSLECRHHVSLSEAIELFHDEATVIRPYIGYAGWGKGQLEGELAQNAWFLKRPDPNTLDMEEAPNLWRRLVGTFGPKYRLIAEFPENPTLN